MSTLIRAQEAKSKAKEQILRCCTGLPCSRINAGCSSGWGPLPPSPISQVLRAGDALPMGVHGGLWGSTLEGRFCPLGLQSWLSVAEQPRGTFALHEPRAEAWSTPAKLAGVSPPPCWPFKEKEYFQEGKSISRFSPGCQSVCHLVPDSGHASKCQKENTQISLSK